MKKYLATYCLLIFTLLVIFFPAFSQDTQGIPNLSLRERDFDFGEVKVGSRMSHPFTVRNKGTATLEIKKVSPSQYPDQSQYYTMKNQPKKINNGHLRYVIDTFKLESGENEL